MQIKNALVVGGQKRCWQPVLKYLASCGVQIFEHWTGDEYLRSKLPVKTDLAIVISSQVSHPLSHHAKQECEKHGIPRVFTSHKFAKFPEDLAKWGIVPIHNAQAIPDQPVALEEARLTPLVPIEEVLADAVQLKQKEEVPMTKATNGNGKGVENRNVARGDAKVVYLKELLKENPYAPPDYLNGKIAEKFPSTNPTRTGGMARTLIGKVRLEEHGLRLGPAGRVWNKKGERIDIPEKYRIASTGTGKRRGRPPGSGKKAQRQVEANVEASQSRITAILGELRTAMQAEGIAALTVPLEGTVQARRMMQVELPV